MLSSLPPPNGLIVPSLEEEPSASHPYKTTDKFTMFYILIPVLSE
jgi:hypothetical protein